MNIAIYILSGLTMAACTATAVLYQMRKNVGALIAKMLAAVLFGYGLLAAAILYLPISGLYLLPIGFSLPCLLGQFFVRTVLKQYCG